jgi:hypothetical protein
MAVSKKKNNKKPKSTRWYGGDVPFEDLGPSERVAHDIVQKFGDLAPSVDRIMDADLTSEQRLQAINLFNASLGTLRDPHRDPRTAIEAARNSVD